MSIINDRDVLLQGTATRNIDPSAGRALLLIADASLFHVSTAGAGTPASITLSARPLNIPANATWSVSAGGTLSGSSANIRTLAFTDMTVAQVTVSAQIVYNGVTYSASQVIGKVVDGTLGPLAATAYMYQWAVSAPAAPTGTTTYTWATGASSAYSLADGWGVAPPANPGTPGLQLWMVSKPLTAAAGTITSTVGYAGLTAVSIAMNGAMGVTGAPGIKSAIARAYQWGLSAPTVSGSAIYTWSTASYDNVPVTGWAMSKPPPPAAGYTLYEAAIGLVDGTAAATASINWSGASVSSIGYVGINGANGANGNTGATGSSAVMCYTLANTQSLNLSPATTTVAGFAYPATGTWGETRAWVAQPTTAPAAGQAWFQSNGIWNGTNIVWGVPYLSNLKVGSLAAISANLGSITAGSVHGASFHTGGMTGYAWPAAGAGGGTYLGPGGLIIGNFNEGKYFQVNDNGDLAMPGLTVASGVATFSGTLYGASGTFAGTILAGAVIAATISGNQVTGGTITGLDVHANSLMATNIDVTYAGEGVVIYRNPGLLRVYKNLGHGVGTETIVELGDAGSASSCGVFGTASAGNNRIGVKGISVGAYGVQGMSISSYGVYGVSNSLSGVYGASTTGNGVEGISFTGYGVRGSTNNGYGVYGSSNAGTGVKGLSTSGNGVEGAASGGSYYDFYATGGGINYGPFTGGHDGLALIADSYIPGDILVDVGVIARSGISNTIAHNELSTSANQKNVIGIFVGERPLSLFDLPAALKDYPDLATLGATYKCITQNAVGEGQVNVCGEGGNIEAGDYITTSSTPGKGMRQADTNHHNYTVAKARESVTFSSSSEIKMVACTYHCG
ncbi:hypothetical protein AAKU55_003137 [Oxalobacteraceae bacterium GrIS 1.11]